MFDNSLVYFAGASKACDLQTLVLQGLLSQTILLDILVGEDTSEGEKCLKNAVVGVATDNFSANVQ